MGVCVWGVELGVGVCIFVCVCLCVWGKLMQSNQPPAKFSFKSDSNCILIDFLDPISAIGSTRRDDSIQIRTI